ncbi:MAG: hypothetical protein M3068_06095 [Gemmatimonadota bacterium]|nr:hypothetical protein [Gemmatimonadota bacterium]
MPLAVNPQLSCAPALTAIQLPPLAGETTATAILPEIPSLVAVTSVLPSRSPSASPLPPTRTMLVSRLDQVMSRLVTGAPVMSRGVALSRRPYPSSTRPLSGAMVTAVTADGATVIRAEPMWPSLVAITVTVPVPTASRTPACDTLATSSLLLLQTTRRPASARPAASLTVATNCTRSPTAMLRPGACTDTAATSGGATLSPPHPPSQNNDAPRRTELDMPSLFRIGGRATAVVLVRT